MRTSVLVAVLVLIPMSYADAQIPPVERDALIALYNSTDGANWWGNTNWLGAVGTECSWYGVTCTGGRVQSLILDQNHLNGSIPPELGNLSSLEYVSLDQNQLNGSIPPELGNLSSLENLYLDHNQLSGNIPAELGNLSNLGSLYLGRNQLSGNIPPELGNLSSVEWLYLGHNQLSGNIPAQLGNLSSVKYLDLQVNQLRGNIPANLGNLSSVNLLFLGSNQLSGDIPASLENLWTLWSGWGLDLHWNALHSDNASLIAFLNSKHLGDWQSTQTIAPVNLIFDRVGDHTVWLTWDAVTYQSDPGGYELFSAPTVSDDWTSGGWTESKTITTFPVTGLDPATSYDLAVVTYTDPHLYQLNLVISDRSDEATAVTGSMGCAQPIIKIGWSDPVTLSVLGSWDTYLWSTGETTPSINVSPAVEQWYWVTVTSAGPCEETAAVMDLFNIFADNFESGDTSAWSNTVP